MADAWDVLVVGAGSAGAAIAARLSEDANTRVLLLEAGPNHTSAETPPSISGKSQFGAISEPGRIWPTLTAVHADGRAPEPYVRGRGVGGSSAVNAQCAIRGLPGDYDRWAVADWDWSGVKGAFDRVAQRIPAERRPEPEWSTFDRRLVAASVERGHPRCDSYETEGVLGAAPVGLTRRAGRRVSTNDAYLEPARARSNLAITGDVLVDRVLIQDARATGVQTSDGEVRAGRVVVSAGTIHSPAILLRSGLDAVRPSIGRNLMEHPRVMATVSLKTGVADGDHDAPSSGFMLRWSSRLPGCGEADLQLIPLNHVVPGAPQIVLVIAALMEPFSRGLVTLASDDPAKDPSVEFKMLSDPRDAPRLRLAAQELFAVLAHPDVYAILDSATLDGRGTTPADLADSHKLDEWLPTAVSDYVHACGTCRMGAPDDPSAVVDPQCRFIGIDDLFVADASIAPVIPRANTHLTAVMIGEKAAALMQQG